MCVHEFMQAAEGLPPDGSHKLAEHAVRASAQADSSAGPPHVLPGAFPQLWSRCAWSLGGMTTLELAKLCHLSMLHGAHYLQVRQKCLAAALQGP